MPTVTAVLGKQTPPPALQLANALTRLLIYFVFISEHVCTRNSERDFEMSSGNGVVATETVQNNVALPPPPSRQVSPSKNWVHFDEEQGDASKNAPAVISTENVQVNLERSLSSSVNLEASNVAVVDPKPLRNVELPVATVEPIRQGFSKLTDWPEGLLKNCCFFLI